MPTSRRSAPSATTDSVNDGSNVTMRAGTVASRMTWLRSSVTAAGAPDAARAQRPNATITTAPRRAHTVAARLRTRAAAHRQFAACHHQRHVVTHGGDLLMQQPEPIDEPTGL